MTKTKKWIGWIVAALVLVIAAGWYWRYREAHKVVDIQYQTLTVERRRIVGRVTASGTLQALVTVQVGSQVSGRIKELYVDFNSPVKKGQLVAKLDPALFQAAAEQAAANYASAKAEVEKAEATALNAERQYERTKALAEQSLASIADLQTAETNVLVAKAGIAVAKASLEQTRAASHQAQVNLSYTNIYSPIDGIVISRDVDVGQTVAASLQAPVLFTIAEDLRKMQVNTNVAEADVGRLQPGMSAYFTVDAFPGERFRGTIGQIRNAAQTVQNVVTYDAVINVTNDDLRLRPGMTANVTILYDERDAALAVPNAALRFRPPPEMTAVVSSGSAASAPPPRAPGSPGEGGNDARTIWVLRLGVPQPVSIRVGLSDGTWTEVKEGDLHEGDQVITDVTTPSKGPESGSKPPGGGGGTRGMRML